MPIKEVKPNAYSLFTRDMQSRWAETGERVSLPVAFQRAKQYWEAMTEDEKGPWKQMAKDQRKEGVRETVNKRPRDLKWNTPRETKVNPAFKTSIEHYSVKDYYQDPDEIMAYQKKRLQDLDFINNRLFFRSPTGNRMDWLFDQSFVFVSVISYLEMAKQKFLPAEMAVAKYKIRHGVVEFRHYLLAPDKELVDNIATEEQLIERRDDPVSGHGIWMGRVEALEDKYELVYKQIWAIISQHDIIYCNASHYNDVRGCLNFIRAKYLQFRGMKNEEAKTEPRLVGLEELVKVLCHFPIEKVPVHDRPHVADIDKAVCPSSLMCAEKVDPTACCLYHRETENQNCAVRLASTALWEASLFLADRLHFELEPLAVPETRRSSAFRAVELNRGRQPRQDPPPRPHLPVAPAMVAKPVAPVTAKQQITTAMTEKPVAPPTAGKQKTAAKPVTPAEKQPMTATKQSEPPSAAATGSQTQVRPPLLVSTTEARSGSVRMPIKKEIGEQPTRKTKTGMGTGPQKRLPNIPSFLAARVGKLRTPQ